MPCFLAEDHTKSASTTRIHHFSGVLALPFLSGTIRASTQVGHPGTGGVRACAWPHSAYVSPASLVESQRCPLLALQCLCAGLCPALLTPGAPGCLWHPRVGLQSPARPGTLATLSGLRAQLSLGPIDWVASVQLRGPSPVGRHIFPPLAVKRM